VDSGGVGRSVGVPVDQQPLRAQGSSECTGIRWGRDSTISPTYGGRSLWFPRARHFEPVRLSYTLDSLLTALFLAAQAALVLIVAARSNQNPAAIALCAIARPSQSGTR